MIISDSPVRPAEARLRRLVAFCLDVVFPPACARCGRAGWMLCPQCENEMVRVPESICARCGRLRDPVAGAERDRLCGECRSHPPLLVQMRASLRYQEPTDRIIHRFKYEGYFALAEPLSRFLIAAWPAWERTPDLILPVPLHPRRRRRRGYNQSELLARPLGRALGIPVVVSALERTRHTAPQVGLGPDERHANVRGAFTAQAAVVRDQDVLLVDDVLTTGATMSAAAEALLAAGAASVSAYCLARVS